MKKTDNKKNNGRSKKIKKAAPHTLGRDTEEESILVNASDGEYLVSKSYYVKKAGHAPKYFPSYAMYESESKPKKVYDRFTHNSHSKKSIIFPEEVSRLLMDVFNAASGNEIMFYSEIIQDGTDSDRYIIDSINFPPQSNKRAYVETVDGLYEKWIFDEIISKGKNIPVHAHTHPDFRAYSSSVDEKQIKQYIADNEGNPFIVQLIISNPRKQDYFVRWFDLVNNTWETPSVKFTYPQYDLDSRYPGIFDFPKNNYIEKLNLFDDIQLLSK